MKTIRSEGEEDLGGRRNPLSEGVPSPSKPPLTSPNFPQEHPPVQSEDLIRFVQGGCSWGKFLLVWEVGRCYGVRLSRLIGGYGVVQPLISYIRPHGSFRPDHQLTSYHFYPVAERVKTSAFRWRNAARSSRNSRHGKRLHQNLHKQKRGFKIPLVEGLEGS